MKKILLLAVVALLSIGAHAQQPVGAFTLQPKTGFNIANITGGLGFDSRWAFAGGLEGEYQINKPLSVALGVVYSQQGFQKNSEFIGKIDYLNVPLMLNCYVYKGLAVKAGVQFGFRVGYSMKDGFMIEEGEDITDDADESADEVSDDEFINKFQFAIPVGLSYEIGNFVIDARYNIGVSKVFSQLVSSKASVFQFTVGYKFKL